VETQTITVQDTTAPVISGIPDDVTIDVSNGETIPEPPTNVFASDNCDDNVNLNYATWDDFFDCSRIINHQWTASDNCGNQIIVNYAITVLGELSASITPVNPVTCPGDPVQFTVNPANVGVSWTATGGTFDDNTAVTTNWTMMAPGTYTITVSVMGDDGCMISASTSVTVVGDVEATASNNGPVCTGATLLLSAEGGSSYSWTGPNGFTSTDQNPVIANVGVNNAGTYTVTVSEGSCSSVATTTVVITGELDAEITSNSPICEGETLMVSVDAGTSFSWSGPSGFTSTQQSIEIPNASMGMHSGTYSVTVTDASGCVAELFTFVTIIRPPAPIISSNSPVCTGSDLELFADGGVSYVWTGPANFSSTDQNPVIPNVNPSASGMYTVTVTYEDGCSESSTIDVEISMGTTVNAGQDISVCAGGTINLSASGNGAYFWTGPNGFASLEQNPSIPNATSTTDRYGWLYGYGSGSRYRRCWAKCPKRIHTANL